MRRIRPLGFAATILSGVAAFWACSSFDGEPSRRASEDGQAMLEAGPSTNDAGPAVVDASDAASATPCAKGGGVVWFTSTFDTLSGWAVLSVPTSNSFVVEADGGPLGRGTIAPKTVGPSFAVVYKPGLPTSFAARFSFLMSGLPDGFILHQAYDGTPVSPHLSLSLQSDGFVMSGNGANVILGPRGDAGARHTILYVYERATPNGVATAKVTFDGKPADLVVPATEDVYDNFQLGPFWPPPDAAAPELVVDYTDVTIWDCTR